LSKTETISLSEKSNYDKSRWQKKQELRRLYKHESLPHETFTEFQKRITKGTNLDPKILRDAIKMTPTKKTGDVLDWTIQMLNNYSKIMYAAQK